MKRYLLDTNAAGDYIEKQGKVADRVRDARRNGHRIGIAVPVLAELYYGVEFSAMRQRNLKQLQHGIGKLRLWPFDARAAAEIGRFGAELRRLGRPIGLIDMMIAAVAMNMSNCTVVSADNDFKAVPGLNVEDWS